MRKTAIHEAGHYVVLDYLYRNKRIGWEPLFSTIIRRPKLLGYTKWTDWDDEIDHETKECAKIIFYLAGKIAEEFILSYTKNRKRKITSDEILARETAKKLDKEDEILLSKCSEEAKRIVMENKQRIISISEYLLQNETIFYIQEKDIK